MAERFSRNRLTLAGLACLLFVAAAALGPERAGAQPGAAGGEWIYLGVVTETSGAPKWLGETGFVYADAGGDAKVVPSVGDRLTLTVVKGVRTADAQGRRPFERAVGQFDTIGELAPGAVVKVLEIGKQPTSKAGDRWQCWVRIERT